MLRRIASALALAGLAALMMLGAGCAKKLGPAPNADKPPHTTLFVKGNVDSVNHLVHLYWYGTDADGYVVGYEFKLVNPEDPDPTHQEWTFTTKTDSLFTIYSPLGGAAPTLYMRAIDNEGVRDPDPATQLFKFRNHAPIVTLTTKPNRTDLSDTTFASVTVGWSISDPDGDVTKARYHVWLDDDSTNFVETQSTTFTVPSSRFVNTSNYVTRHLLTVRAIDDGGMAGPVDTVSWWVRRPVMGSRNRVLIIDETPGTGTGVDPARAANQAMFLNAVTSPTVGMGIPRDQVAFLLLASSQPFKSDLDIYQTFKLFETVIWYRGSNTGASSYSTVLYNYQNGLGAYLADHGKVYLESLNMCQGPLSAGALSSEFLSTYANVSRLFLRQQAPDSAAYWGLATGSRVYCPTLADSLIVTNASPGGLNAFVVRNPSQIFMQVNENSFTQGNPIPMPVALSVGQASGGRLILNTFPMIVGGGARTRVMAGIMRELGLNEP